MSALTALKLTNTKRSTGLPPLLVRRQKLISKITEQIQLAHAQQQGAAYNATRVKSVRDESGERRTIEVERRLRQWWWTAENGKTCLNIRYGARALEIQKGKSTIEVGDAARLVETLSLIKAATEAGELDTQIEAVSAVVRTGFGK